MNTENQRKFFCSETYNNITTALLPQLRQSLPKLFPYSYFYKRALMRTELAHISKNAM